MKPIWARNIKTRRKELGFESAEKFAEKLEMPYPTYRDIEGGVSEGGYENRLTIATALKWTVSDLYRDHSRPNRESDFTEAATFLMKYASLDPDIQKVILMILYGDDSYIETVSRASLSRVIKVLSPALKIK